MLVSYRKKNFDCCVNLYVAAFTAPPLNFDFITHENARRYLRDIAHTPGFLGFVYVLDGTIAAFCFGAIDNYFHGVQYEIKELAVAPALHGHGIGSAIMTAIETELAGRSVEGIYLQTSRAIPAYQFYLANGFDDVPNNVSMAKPLGN